MSEADIQAAIQIALSRGPVRLLRINAGISWSGRIIHQTPTSITLSPYGAVKLADSGVSDLVGWSPVELASGAIGALYTAVECKSERGRVRPAQQAFIDLVLAAGGRAGVARSVDEARAIIEGRR